MHYYCDMEDKLVDEEYLLEKKLACDPLHFISLSSALF